ncbi:MAG: DUF559 domain-containing protein [Gordonia sp. (in: high G+C Gram-positive bacteria)]
MTDAPPPPPSVGAAVRPGHVLRLDDVGGETLAELVDSVSPDLPVVLDYRGPDDRSARTVTTEVLDALEGLLLTLFPTWLGQPAGTLLDLDEALALAGDLVRQPHQISAVVRALARAGATGHPPRRRPAAEIRAAGLFALLRHAYGRPEVTLAVRASGELSATAQHAAAAACEWLARHGRLTIWLTADALPAVTRVPRIRLGLPGAADAPIVTVADPDAPVLVVSRPIGAPAPHSAAEQALERALSHAGVWATARRWNRTPPGLDILAKRSIVDIHWPGCRVVVEIDGPEHRNPAKYADDRRRDNMLQRHGFVVLRYVNEQVLADPEAVVAELHAIIEERSGRAAGHRTEELAT